MKINDFAGTGTLMRLFGRRDRVLFPFWTMVPAFLCLAVAATFLPMGEKLHQVLTEFNHDILISALLGPILSLDLQGAIVWRGFSQLTLALGIGSFWSVIRHTRADEESGRSDLIRSYVVGRCADLSAALVLTVIGDLASGALIALVISLLGAPPAGSVLFGATVCLTGCFFAGIGALGAQMSESSGGARALGFVAIGLGMALAILNNFAGGDTVLRWLTPMAWQRLTAPFAGNHFIILLYCLAAALVPALLAFLLSFRRDLTAGVLPDHPGRAEASPLFSRPIALAWKLQKRSLGGWLVGTVLYMAVFAALAPGLSRSGRMSGWLSGIVGSSDINLSEAFIGISLYLLAIFIAVYAISAALRLKSEEKAGRVELLVDKPLAKADWMASHLTIAFGGSALLLLIVGAVGGLIFGQMTGDLSHAFPRVMAMSLSKVPPIWLFTSIAVLLYGLFPKLTGLAWLFWFGSSLLELAWEEKLVSWSAMRLSPYSYAHYTIEITRLPLLPLIGLVLLAGLLTVLGMAGFRRRDVMTKS